MILYNIHYDIIFIMIHYNNHYYIIFKIIHYSIHYDIIVLRFIVIFIMI